MAYYSAFQSNAFQGNAFQIKRQPAQTAVPTFTFSYPYKKEEKQKQKIKKHKTDLAKLESVLRETERKRKLAAESREKTKQLKRALELEKQEKDFLEEINRLLMVRVELIRAIRESEAFLIILIMMRKRRLRAF